MFPDPETVEEALEDGVLFSGPADEVDNFLVIEAAARGFLALHQAISQPTDEMRGVVARAIYAKFADAMNSGTDFDSLPDYEVEQFLLEADGALAAVASVLLADERNENDLFMR
jgi:hypothetical protein